MSSRKVEIDTRTFIRFWIVIILFIATLFFIYKAWSGLIVVALGAFLALAIRPLGDRINNIFKKKQKKNKEKLSYILAFVLVVALLSGFLIVISPMIISETTKFAQQAPIMFEKNLGGWSEIDSFANRFGVVDVQEKIMSFVNKVSVSVVENIGKILGSVGSVFGMLFMATILAIFFLLEGPKLYNSLWTKINKNNQSKSKVVIREMVAKMTNVFSTFVSKQIVIAILDGTVVTVVTFLLSIIFKFSSSLALPIGLISMAFYLIPMFGQFIGCLINTLILLVSNPLAGLVYAIVYLVYSQVEGNFIAPKIQGNAMNLSPLIILISIVIGTYAFGLVGAIIAIPIAGCVKVFLDEYPRLKEASEKE